MCRKQHVQDVALLDACILFTSHSYIITALYTACMHACCTYISLPPPHSPRPLPGNRRYKY